jgi:hypothetical protein
MQRTANFLPRLSFLVLAAVVLVSLPTLAAAGTAEIDEAIDNLNLALA